MMRQGPIEALREIVERISNSVRSGTVLDAYLAGGTATFIHLKRAAGSLAQEARYSDDADIHFRRPLVLGDDIVVRYQDERDQERLLALDRTYSIDLGLRHPDCLDDASFLFESDNGRVRLHVLNPLDLAVTKAGRYEDHDRMDIELLARGGLLDAEAFHKRATEALDYLATDPAMVEINIGEAKELIHRAQKPDSSS